MQAMLTMPLMFFGSAKARKSRCWMEQDASTFARYNPFIAARFGLLARHTITRDALPYSITLIQAIPKGKTFDTIVQKATELGVARIIPLLSSRVVVHLEEANAENKVQKWRHVAIEAIKQCGSPWLPMIAKPIKFADLAKAPAQYDLSMVGFLGHGTAHPRTFFEDFLGRSGQLPGSVALWVGPEGDFTPEEVSTLLSLGREANHYGPPGAAQRYCGHLRPLFHQLRTANPLWSWENTARLNAPQTSLVRACIRIPRLASSAHETDLLGLLACDDLCGARRGRGWVYSPVQRAGPERMGERKLRS